MLEMYSTPLDILYLVLSIGGGLLLLFLVIAVYHIIKILGNVNKVTSKAKDTVDLINHYLWQPIKIAMMIIEKGKEMAEKKKSKK
ncbi:hypothetical protein JW758_01265 [Candidatus Peregrinibacteria bacterium]|nr:hypothetical protein [Candidatus Peregrinibacteria bacterium]